MSFRDSYFDNLTSSTLERTSGENLASLLLRLLHENRLGSYHSSQGEENSNKSNDRSKLEFQLCLIR